MSYIKYLIDGAVLLVGLIYVSDSSNKAYSSLDFAGSIGFDMFDEHDGDTPFRHDNDNYYNGDNNDRYEGSYPLIVRIDTGEKYNMPDFKISTESDSTVSYGSEFEDDGKAKVRLNIDDDDSKVCIQTVNSSYHYKKCKPIDSDEITFTLTPKQKRN